MNISNTSRRVRFARRVVGASLAAWLTLSAVPGMATVTTTGMSVARMMHRASALPDGRVVVTGGYARPGTTPYASAEIYDPATGRFAPIAPMLQGREEHASVTLQDGRVMVIGGSIATNPSLVGTATTEIYDPTTGQWTAAASMSAARWRALAQVLPNGKVFVMSEDGYGPSYAEVYDPQTNTFSQTGNMIDLTGWHGLVALADGRVLKVGGFNRDYLKRAEIWDPATNQWTATGSMNEARQSIRPVLLPDGKVLVAGGNNTSNLATVEIYDPATGQFTPGNAMPVAMEIRSASVLSNGDIVLTDDYSTNLVRYQYSTGLWNLTGPKRTQMRETSVTLLPGNDLLLAGGAELNDASPYAGVWDHACAPRKIALLDGNTRTLDVDGGQANFTVAGAPGCHFDVSGLPNWLASGSSDGFVVSATGSTTVGVSAAANQSGAERSAAFFVGNNAASLTQLRSSVCPVAPTLSPGTLNFDSKASSGMIQVAAAATCPWRFTGLPSWLTADLGSSGTGNGHLSYTVAANTGEARVASALISGPGYANTVMISQAGASPCPTSPKLSHSFLNYTADGATTTIQVEAAASCAWLLSGLPSWATAGATTSGVGNGSFTFTVAPNNGVARSGSGQISGPGYASTFNLSQAASPCASWSMNPRVLSLPVGGTTGSLTITAAATCSWSVGGLPSWMTLTTAASGSGNGTIGYSIAANAGTARSATATLSGSGPALSLALSQDGVPPAGCTTPITSGTPITSTLASNTCPAGARGASYYTNRYSFNGTPGGQVTIVLTSSAFDTYLYLRNPAGTVITSNDDGAGGTNSRIPASSGSYTLPTGSAGVYTIEVTAYAAGKGGAYTLSLTQQ